MYKRQAYTLVCDTAGLRNAGKIILPGVGHFGQMMRALEEMRVRDVLIERIRAGAPFLGICLGLQALFECSEEAPEARGLGLYLSLIHISKSLRLVPRCAPTI